MYVYVYVCEKVSGWQSVVVEEGREGPVVYIPASHSDRKIEFTTSMVAHGHGGQVLGNLDALEQSLTRKSGTRSRHDGRLVNRYQACQPDFNSKGQQTVQACISHQREFSMV